MQVKNVYSVSRTGFFCGHCQETLTTDEVEGDECPYCRSTIACLCIPVEDENLSNEELEAASDFLDKVQREGRRKR